MKIKHLLIIFALLTLLLPVVLADTGTYVIEKQTTDLTIQEGTTDVVIDYYMKMRVTGGNIPWVTIGLPDSNFDIKESGLNVASIRADSSYGWSGVYLDLDKTYYKEQSFEISFKAIQKNFVKRYGESASISFIPNWWDNAVTENLGVNVIILGNISNVTTSSQPQEFTDNKIVWSWTDVRRGEKKEIGVILPLSAFPTLATQAQEQPSDVVAVQNIDTNSNGLFWFFVITFALLILGRGIFSMFSSDYDSPSVSVSSNFVRHVNMDCPNDNSRLNKRTIKDTTIDFCEICGGCFFDRGEIESLIKSKVDEKDLNTNNISKWSAEIKSSIKCPKCETLMTKKTKTKDEKEYTIYLCDECDGIWLNRGMYQLIKDKRLDQEDKQKKKKEDDDSYFPIYWWLFYPHLSSTGASSTSAIAHYGAGSFGGGGASRSSSSSTSSYSAASSCVSCACVSACACACACAGGGGASCAPKNKLECHQINIDKFYSNKKAKKQNEKK